MKETFEKAEQGDAVAQNKVGLWYYTGENVSKDRVKAKDFFKKAAVQKHVGAQFNLATMLYEEKIFPEALQLFLETSEKGNVDATVKAGGMYYRGEGVKKDVSQALKFFKNAAFQRNVIAQINVGVILQEEESLQDLQEAVKWFSKAAAQGSSEAKFKLALAYSQGKGVQKDLLSAFNFCMEAAEQNHLQAQFNAGLMFYEGIGTGKNPQEACKWFLRAATQGHNLAQYRTAKAYLMGVGTKQDFGKAIEWSLRLLARLLHHSLTSESELNLAKEIMMVCYCRILLREKSLQKFTEILLSSGKQLTALKPEEDFRKAEEYAGKEDLFNAFFHYCLAAQANHTGALERLQSDYNVSNDNDQGRKAVFVKYEMLGKKEPQEVEAKKSDSFPGVAKLMADHQGYGHSREPAQAESIAESKEKMGNKK